MYTKKSIGEEKHGTKGHSQGNAQRGGYDTEAVCRIFWHTDSDAGGLGAGHKAHAGLPDPSAGLQDGDGRTGQEASRMGRCHGYRYTIESRETGRTHSNKFGIRFVKVGCRTKVRVNGTVMERRRL